MNNNKEVYLLFRFGSIPLYIADSSTSAHRLPGMVPSFTLPWTGQGVSQG